MNPRLHGMTMVKRGREMGVPGRMKKFAIAAASVFLPLTKNPGISRELGTRHRAAIGVTEGSDAVSIVVSEETGLF